MAVRAGLAVVANPNEPTPPDRDTGANRRRSPRMSWFSPAGTEIALTSPELGWKLLEAVEGLGAMPTTLVQDKLPRGGSRVRGVRREPREVDLPVRIWGYDHHQFLDRKHILIDAFTQTDEMGPGTLVVYRPDGTQRQISAYYLQGLEKTRDGWIAENAIITLFCENPWWLGPAEIEDEIVQEDPGGSYLDPFPNVSSSRNTIGGVTIYNPGELMSYPRWTFIGPASAITVTNDDTGAAFTINPNFAGGGNLLTGQIITVNTDPMTIIGPAGQPYTGALNWPGASLFGLRRGDNHLTVAFSGAVTGSTVRWAFSPRYRSA